MKLRKGYRTHSTSMGSGAVEALFEHVTAAGVKKLIACANNKIYNATTFNAAATDITNGATITSNRWQGTQFGGSLILCNGVDQPLNYNGTTVTSATYTAATGYTLSDDATLVQPYTHKGRVYFAQKDSAKVWYGNANEVTGELRAEDFSGRLRLGGYIQFIASSSINLGGFMDECLVVVSSEGEVLAYSGDAPNQDNWQVAAHYYIAAPIGRRAGLVIGKDLAIITTDGLVPLSAVTDGTSTESSFIGISDKIAPTFRDKARDYKANFGWCTFVYPAGSWLMVSIPTTESSRYEQYVMNLKSKAWTRFYGMHAASWCLFNDKAYFGGIDGKVYEADQGTSDNGAFIATDLKGAYNALGDPRRNKLAKQVKPQIETDSRVLNVAFSLDFDYRNTAMNNTVQVVGTGGSAWDTSAWDSSPWDDQNRNFSDAYGVTGMGKTVAVRMQGDFKSIAIGLSSFDIFFEQGGIL